MNRHVLCREPTALIAAALTRAPYLTDLVGAHVDVNFATDRSAVQIGDVQDGEATGVAFDFAAFGTSCLGVT